MRLSNKAKQLVGFASILTLASAFSGCASSSRPSLRLNVEGILNRFASLEVSDDEGFREAVYVLGGVREEHRRLCLLWPLARNRVNSSFGKRWGRKHQGIDLRAPTGTPVLAALPGRVIHSGTGVRGYGKLIVLKHSRGLSTVYAHNSVLRVKHGQLVAQGDVIALSGATGRVSGPHLHFEVRDHGRAINPLGLLLASVRKREEAGRLCVPTHSEEPRSPEASRPEAPE